MGIMQEERPPSVVVFYNKVRVRVGGTVSWYRKNDPPATLYSTTRLGLELGVQLVGRKNDPAATLYSTTRLGLGFWLI